jgi:PRTRC genetic system ThiF family protein
MPHLIPAKLLQNQVKIALVGCGGNGSQMLTGLARLNHAMVALDHPGLIVCAFDPDTVSEANIGRQLFGAFDIGASKAHTLINRVNAYFGLTWKAYFGRYDWQKLNADIIIVCVDSAKSRHEIMRTFQRSCPMYLMDMGNRAADGQVLFGELRAVSASPAGSARLPSPYDLLPELVDAKAVEDDTPSCGLAEALERQELFVNQSIVTPALHILWEFFRHGQLTWHGAFVNLRTGSMRAMQVKEATNQPPAEQIRITV